MTATEYQIQTAADLLVGREQDIYRAHMVQFMPPEIYKHVCKRPLPNCVNRWIIANGWNFKIKWHGDDLTERQMWHGKELVARHFISISP